MSSTALGARSPATVGATRRLPQPYWNPYVAGVVLGLVLLATYLLTGRGLGATGAFSALVAWVANAISPAAAQANPVHVRYLEHGPPLLSFLPFLVLGTFVGGWISAKLAGRIRVGYETGPRIGVGGRLALAFVGGVITAFGGKIAMGCTSGQALSGMAVLNVGSLVFMLSMFATGYVVAYLARKEWL